MTSSKREYIPDSVRQNAYVRDNWTCQLCDKSPPEVKLTLHHIQEVSEGGLPTLDNLMTVCADCHRYIPLSYEPTLRGRGTTTDDMSGRTKIYNTLDNLLKLCNMVITVVLVAFVLLALIYMFVLYPRTKDTIMQYTLRTGETCQ